MDGRKKRVEKSRMKTGEKEDDGEADPQKHNERLYLFLFRWSFSKWIVASCFVFTVKCTVSRIQGGLLLACWHLISTWHPHPYSSPYILFLRMSVFLSCCSPLCLLYKTHGHHVYRAVSSWTASITSSIWKWKFNFLKKLHSWCKCFYICKLWTVLDLILHPKKTRLFHKLTASLV